jgi:hypothetical protein
LVNVNDPLFTDLALKVIAGRASEAERSELAARVAGHPELEAELESLRADAAFAREVLPLLGDEQVKAGELPGYARVRLQAAVKQTFKQPTGARTDFSMAGLFHRWQWWFGLSAAAAVGLIVACLHWPHRAGDMASRAGSQPSPQKPLVAKNTLGILQEGPLGGSLVIASNATPGLGQPHSGDRADSFAGTGIPLSWGSNVAQVPAPPKGDLPDRTEQPPALEVTNLTPIIQLAMLDSVGQTRAGAALQSTTTQIGTRLKQALQQTNLTIFSETADLTHWLEQWSDQKEQTILKVWFNRDAGEVRVLAVRNGKRLIEKSFAVENEGQLPVVLKQAIESFEPASQTPIRTNK